MLVINLPKLRKSVKLFEKVKSMAFMFDEKHSGILINIPKSLIYTVTVYHSERCSQSRKRNCKVP